VRESTMPGYANPYQAQNTPTPPGFDEDYYLNADPDAAFWKYLQNMGYGLGAQAPVARYAQGRQGQVYNTYKSVAAADPNMGFWDWLKKNPVDLNQDFYNQSPEQRGDFSSRIMTPRARWSG